MLCLDDFVTPKMPTKTGYRNSIQIAKMDLSYMASMLLHGGGKDLHTPNRWFDKFLQVIDDVVHCVCFVCAILDAVFALIVDCGLQGGNLWLSSGTFSIRRSDSAQVW